MLSRLLDVVWAFPVYLLAICLSIVLIAQGFASGPFTLESGSLLLPIFIIGIVYIPYVARPIRGQVLSLRQKRVRRGGDRARCVDLAPPLERHPAAMSSRR